MPPDKTERNANPFLFQTGIRTVKKLGLALTIHGKNVTMARPVRVLISVVPFHLKSVEVLKLTDTMSFVSLRSPNRGSLSLCHPTCDLLPR